MSCNFQVFANGRKRLTCPDAAARDGRVAVSLMPPLPSGEYPDIDVDAVKGGASR
jgi:hypothetical protein